MMSLWSHMLNCMTHFRFFNKFYTFQTCKNWVVLLQRQMSYSGKEGWKIPPRAGSRPKSPGFIGLKDWHLSIPVLIDLAESQSYNAMPSRACSQTSHRGTDIENLRGTPQKQQQRKARHLQGPVVIELLSVLGDIALIFLLSRAHLEFSIHAKKNQDPLHRGG